MSDGPKHPTHQRRSRRGFARVRRVAPGALRPSRPVASPLRAMATSERIALIRGLVADARWSQARAEASGDSLACAYLAEVVGRVGVPEVAELAYAPTEALACASQPTRGSGDGYGARRGDGAGSGYRGYAGDGFGVGDGAWWRPGRGDLSGEVIDGDGLGDGGGDGLGDSYDIADG